MAEAQMASSTLTGDPGPGTAAGRKRQPHLPHPAFAEVVQQRANSWQLRLADRITAFAGAMIFVWIHAVLFGLWIATDGLGLTNDPFPFNFLTMVVSLEAIFLSTFVMIGQNRQAQFAAKKAEHDFNEQDLELKKNTRLTEATHTNTLLIHLMAHKMGITEAEMSKALANPEAV
jgi:uncharacterized membrane protein